MASGREYLDFILEQLSELEGVAYKPMMREYLLYYNNKYFGGVYDDQFLVKVSPSAVWMMPDAERQPPYEGAKDMLVVTDLYDRVFLKEMIKALCDELPTPKKKRKKGES